MGEHQAPVGALLREDSGSLARRRAPRARDHGRQRFQAVFDNAAIGIALVDMAGHPMESNPALERMLGYSAEEELTSMVFTDFTHPDDAAADWELFQELIQDRRDHYQMEKRYLRKDGEQVWGRLTVSLVRDEEGEPEYAIGMVEDITERKRAEAGLQSAEERYQTLVEQLPGVVYTAEFGESGRWHYASPFSKTMLGFSSEDWIADPELWWRQVHTDDRERVLRDEASSRETGEGLRSEYRMHTRSGDTVWVMDVAGVVRDEEGESRFLRGVILDITKQKQAERDLAESAGLLRAIFRSEPECVKLVGWDGTLLQMNPAGLEMIEADSADAVIGECVYPLVVEEHRAAFRAVNEAAFEGRSGTVEFDIVGLKGTRRSMEMNAAPLRGPGGEVVACLSITRDVTDRKSAAAELEATLEDLRRSNDERLRILSRLISVPEDERRRIASDLHDDTTQKLCAAGLRLASLEAKHPSLAGDANYVAIGDCVQEAIARLRDLMFELRPPALDQEGLASAVRELLDRMADGLEHSLIGRLERQPPPEVAAAAYRITQEALANVRKHAQATHVEVALGSHGDVIFVRVQDDGVGFSPWEADVGRPGHIGLMSMRERAELAGGWLRVESQPGQGTKIEFELPA